MLKKLFFLILTLGCTPFFFAALNSCHPNCYLDQCHLTTSVAIKAIDNGDSLPKDPGANGVYAKALQLSVSILDTLSAQAYCSNLKDPFTPSAMAMMQKKCMENYRYPSVFTITSDKDFDVLHPAHTNLLDLFYTADSTTFYTGTRQYYLMHQPLAEDIHTFKLTVAYYGSDTAVFEAYTVPVKLLKQ